MALICKKCGKSIGIFSKDPFKFEDNSCLCYECAEPISYNISCLYYEKNETDFSSLKQEILATAKEEYTQEIVNAIENKINAIFHKVLFVDDSTEVSYRVTDMQQKKILSAHKLTTGYDFEGYKIADYLGVVSGQTVLGTGFLSEFTASLADFFGEQSNKFADKLEQAKAAATEKMILKSYELGGNALIGVDFDYITFDSNMIGVVANGTSVVIEEL